MRHSKKIVCGMLLFSLSSLAATLDINETLGIRARAMGGAGRAVSTTNEAVTINPAGLAQFTRFNLDGDYVHRVTEATHWVGLSVVDSTSSPFAGGIDFHVGIDPTKGSQSMAYVGTFSTSLPVSPQRLHLGANFKYAYLPVSEVDSLVNQFTVDTGALVLMDYGLSAAVTAYNLVPTHSKRLPLSVGFGVALKTSEASGQTPRLQNMIDGLTVALDWIMRDLTSKDGFTNQLMVGGEYLIGNIVPLRFGYKYGLEAKEHVITGGTGFASNDIGLDGFFEQNLTNTADRSFGVALRLLF